MGGAQTSTVSMIFLLAEHRNNSGISLTRADFHYWPYQQNKGIQQTGPDVIAVENRVNWRNIRREFVDVLSLQLNTLRYHKKRSKDGFGMRDK